MQAEHGVDLRVLEHALALIIGSRRRPAALLGRLEDELHRAGQIRPRMPRQHGGHAEQDGHVVVVAAGVHHADFLAVELRLRRRLERQVDLLGDRQRVHVGPQRRRRGPACRP